jgi:ribosomal protein S17E
MSTPVTRGELREELASFEQRLEPKFVTKAELREELARSEQRLEQKFEHKFVTKQDLRNELASYPTKEDLRNELAKYATKQDLDSWGGALLERITVEIGRAVRAAMESARISVNAVDDQYRDLPARVARLEAKVFAPKRRRR